MRDLIYFVHASVDGYIDGPNGEFDWPEMGPELSKYSLDLTDGAGVFLYGRVVWDMMASYWPNAESTSSHPHDLAFAPIWRRTPKVVVSRTLTEADWNARVIGPDVAEAITALKEESGGAVLLTGGGELGSTLFDLGLIDELRIVVHPVVLGGGKPLLANQSARTKLKLVESRVFDSHSTLTRYSRTGVR